MDASELRIGNFVKWNEEICRVLTISITSIRCYVIDNDLEDDLFNIEELHPIEITPEILAKCGFEKKKEYNEIWKQDTIHYRLEYGSYTIIAQTDSNINDLKIKSIGINYFDGDEESYIPFNLCKSLHQLQNLYWCLCGKELEVNLTQPQLT